VLVVTDGEKGLHAAVREVFGSAAVLHRCQWHKREDVLDYLPQQHRATCRRKLQAAYEEPTYEKAKRALGKIRAELGTSLKSTNALESIHARVESRTAKVDHWKNSEQKQRWLATALLDLEPRLRRIRNYRALPLLRETLGRQIEMKKSAA
jgi:transposase-like protein